MSARTLIVLHLAFLNFFARCGFSIAHRQVVQFLFGWLWLSKEQTLALNRLTVLENG